MYQSYPWYNWHMESAMHRSRTALSRAVLDSPLALLAVTLLVPLLLLGS